MFVQLEDGGWVNTNHIVRVNGLRAVLVDGEAVVLRGSFDWDAVNTQVVPARAGQVAVIFSVDEESGSFFEEVCEVIGWQVRLDRKAEPDPIIMGMDDGPETFFEGYLLHVVNNGERWYWPRCQDFNSLDDARAFAKKRAAEKGMG